MTFSIIKWQVVDCLIDDFLVYKAIIWFCIEVKVNDIRTQNCLKMFIYVVCVKKNIDKEKRKRYIFIRSGSNQLQGVV